MAGQDGEGLSTGGLEGTEAARIVAVRSNAILSLDKAETIAARRLRELAIRLRNNDAQTATDRVPFDADRHFRERLAERMAALGADSVAPESAAPIPYVVSDALSLSALGLSMPLLAGPVARAAPKTDVAEADGASAEPSLEAAHVEDADVDAQRSAAADDDYPVFEPAVRLVDLINQQRTLVTRLADMSLAEDAESEAGADVTARGARRSRDRDPRDAVGNLLKRWPSRTQLRRVVMLKSCSRLRRTQPNRSRKTIRATMRSFRSLYQPSN
ncbi:MAG: hypothetical protein HC868_03270 [Sphingomonadales bacterium]|nr:hypothetical protein [Sphingomonadales bacterium]